MIPEQGLNTTAPAFQVLIKTILYTIAECFGQVQNWQQTLAALDICHKCIRVSFVHGMSWSQALHMEVSCDRPEIGI